MWRQNKMMTKEYFHLCSDGGETPDFITSRKDYIAAMNIVALCAANTDVVVVAFTIEDTHLHLLIYATREECVKFKVMFEKVYTRYAAKREEKGAPFSLEIEIFETGNDEDYVRNIAAYTVIQPTKDGKGILPFDYEWGSGSLYFRSSKIPLLWLCSEGGIVREPIRFGRMTIDKQRETVHSRTLTIPADWLVCDGIVSPTNYVGVARFEGLFRTHNRYRVFLSSSSVKDAEILTRMARERGVMLDDLEARALCGQECKLMFGIRDPRRLGPQNRIVLAQTLRRKHSMTIRQIAKMIRLPESEVTRYVR